jgi:hypothetical protein
VPLTAKVLELVTTQAPARQLPAPVHTSASPSHAVPSVTGANAQPPLSMLQEPTWQGLSELQSRAGPAWQTPWAHTSPSVQALPSSQLEPVTGLVAHLPVLGLQLAE